VDLHHQLFAGFTGAPEIKTFEASRHASGLNGLRLPKGMTGSCLPDPAAGHE
jgi:hypothetical protein